MILSRTSQYAIQALIFIATQPRDVAVLNRTIVKHIGVPPAYLSKVLQNLSKNNMLHSIRGRQGGYCLREKGESINLMQIVLVTEGLSFTEECVLGFKVCSDKTPCLMHTKWAPIKQKIVRLLQDQTLGSLATAVLSGQYKLTDLPEAILGKRKIRA